MEASATLEGVLQQFNDYCAARGISTQMPAGVDLRIVVGELCTTYAKIITGFQGAKRRAPVELSQPPSEAVKYLHVSGFVALSEEQKGKFCVGLARTGQDFIISIVGIEKAVEAAQAYVAQSQS